MRWSSPGGWLVDQLAPGVEIVPPQIVSSGLVFKDAERERAARAAAEIARDMAWSLLTSLSGRDMFYYPSSIKRIQARSSAIELAANQELNLAKSGFSFVLDDNVFEAIGREKAIENTALGVGFTALNEYGKRNRWAVDERQFKKASVHTDSGAVITPAEYLKSEWAPQYAADLMQLFELTSNAEAIS